MHVCELLVVLDLVEFDLHLLLHADDQNVLCYEFDFMFSDSGNIVHPLLLAGDLHGVLKGFDLLPLQHACDNPDFLD